MEVRLHGKGLRSERGEVAQESIGIETSRVSIRPLWLDGVAADSLPSTQVKALLRIQHIGSHDIAEDIRFTAAGCAWAMPSQKFKRQKGFSVVITSDGELVPDFLNGGGLE